jgi:hypothetical protein
MARDPDDRLLVICGYLAVLAAAFVVLAMQTPAADSTTTSLLNAGRFVGAVAATIFGFIAWFERRYPVEGRRVEVRTDPGR